jgi:hypothetical protein
VPGDQQISLNKSMLALLAARASGAHVWRELLKVVAGVNVAAACDSYAAHWSRGFAVLQNTAGDLHYVLAFEFCIIFVVIIAHHERTIVQRADVRAVFETQRVQEELKRLQDRYKQLDTQLAGVHLRTLHPSVSCCPAYGCSLLIAFCQRRPGRRPFWKCAAGHAQGVWRNIFSGWQRHPAVRESARGL